jgi:hypothetical protein
MSQSRKARRRRPRPRSTADARAALRGIAAVGGTLRRSAAALEREEAALAARERRAAASYLRGLARAGVRASALPAGAGVVGGQDRAVVRRHTRQRSTSRALASSIPGLADILGNTTVVLPTATLKPPYSYHWIWTKWIHYAPGKLEAYAGNDGTFGFDIASSHDSHQVNKSRARAGVGGRFRPSEPGVLRIGHHLDVKGHSHLAWHMAVAHAYAWTGLLVQAYDDDNDLVDTPIDGRTVEFNRSGGGGAVLSLPDAEFTVNLPSEGLPSLFVVPERWYAIWAWCGGGIRAAGWQTHLGMNVGSDAASRLDVTVPKINLYFDPLPTRGGGSWTLGGGP